MILRKFIKIKIMKGRGGMQKRNRIISTIITVSFIFNTVLSDIALGQPLNYHPNTNKLAAPSQLDDLVGIEHKDVGRIRLALEARLISLAGKDNALPKTIDEFLRALQAREAFEETKFGPARMAFDNMQIFSREIRSIEEGLFFVKCRIADEKSSKKTRTYYAIFSPIRDKNGGFHIEVCTEKEWDEKGIKRFIETTLAVPARQLQKPADAKAIARYKKHEEGMDAVIRYAHEHGLTAKPNPSNFDYHETVLQLLKHLNIKIENPHGLTPIEDREFWLVKLTPDLQQKMKELDPELAEYRIRYLAHSSNNAVHVFVKEEDYNLLTGEEAIDRFTPLLGLRIVGDELDEAVTEIRDICVHEIGVMLGQDESKLSDGSVFPSFNELDLRYSNFWKTEPVLVATIVNLDENLLTRDYAAGEILGSKAQELLRDKKFGQIIELINQSIKDGKEDDVKAICEAINNASRTKREAFFRSVEWRNYKDKFKEKYGVLIKKYGLDRFFEQRPLDSKVSFIVYNLETGKPVGVDGYFYADYHYTRTATQLAVQSSIGLLTVYDLETGEPIEGFENLDANWGYILTATHLGVRGSFGLLTVYDLETGEPIEGFENLTVSKTNIHRTFTLTATHLAVRTPSDLLTVYNLKTGKPVEGLKNLDAAYGYSTLTPTHLTVLNGDRQTIYNLKTGKPISTTARTHPGKSPEDAKKVIALSGVGRKPFTLEEYLWAYRFVWKIHPWLGLEELAENPERTARRDLDKLVEEGILTCDESAKPYKYQLTEKGKTEIVALQKQVTENQKRSTVGEGRENEPTATQIVNIAKDVLDGRKGMLELDSLLPQVTSYETLSEAKSIITKMLPAITKRDAQTFEEAMRPFRVNLAIEKRMRELRDEAPLTGSQMSDDAAVANYLPYVSVLEELAHNSNLLLAQLVARIGLVLAKHKIDEQINNFRIQSRFSGLIDRRREITARFGLLLTEDAEQAGYIDRIADEASKGKAARDITDEALARALLIVYGKIFGDDKIDLPKQRNRLGLIGDKARKDKIFLAEALARGGLLEAGDTTQIPFLERLTEDVSKSNKEEDGIAEVVARSALLRAGHNEMYQFQKLSVSEFDSVQREESDIRMAVGYIAIMTCLIKAQETGGRPLAERLQQLWERVPQSVFTNFVDVLANYFIQNKIDQIDARAKISREVIYRLIKYIDRAIIYFLVNREFPKHLKALDSKAADRREVASITPTLDYGIRTLAVAIVMNAVQDGASLLNEKLREPSDKRVDQIMARGVTEKELQELSGLRKDAMLRICGDFNAAQLLKKIEVRIARRKAGEDRGKSPEDVKKAAERVSENLRMISDIRTALVGEEFTPKEQFDTVLKILKRYRSPLAAQLEALEYLVDEPSPNKVWKIIRNLPLSDAQKEVLVWAFFTPGEGGGILRDDAAGETGDKSQKDAKRVIALSGVARKAFTLEDYLAAHNIVVKASYPWLGLTKSSRRTAKAALDGLVEHGILTYHRLTETYELTETAKDEIEALRGQLLESRKVATTDQKREDKPAVLEFSSDMLRGEYKAPEDAVREENLKRFARLVANCLTADNKDENLKVFAKARDRFLVYVTRAFSVILKNKEVVAGQKPQSKKVRVDLSGLTADKLIEAGEVEGLPSELEATLREEAISIARQALNAKPPKLLSELFGSPEIAPLQRLLDRVDEKRPAKRVSRYVVNNFYPNYFDLYSVPSRNKVNELLKSLMQPQMPQAATPAKTISEEAVRPETMTLDEQHQKILDEWFEGKLDRNECTMFESNELARELISKMRSYDSNTLLKELLIAALKGYLISLLPEGAKPQDYFDNWDSIFDTILKERRIIFVFANDDEAPEISVKNEKGEDVRVKVFAHTSDRNLWVVLNKSQIRLLSRFSSYYEEKRRGEIKPREAYEELQRLEFKETSGSSAKFSDIIEPFVRRMAHEVGALCNLPHSVEERDGRYVVVNDIDRLAAAKTIEEKQQILARIKGMRPLALKSLSAEDRDIAASEAAEKGEKKQAEKNPYWQTVEDDIRGFIEADKAVRIKRMPDGTLTVTSVKTDKPVTDVDPKMLESIRGAYDQLDYWIDLMDLEGEVAVAPFAHVKDTSWIYENFIRNTGEKMLHWDFATNFVSITKNSSSYADLIKNLALFYGLSTDITHWLQTLYERITRKDFKTMFDKGDDVTPILIGKVIEWLKKARDADVFVVLGSLYVSPRTREFTHVRRGITQQDTGIWLAELFLRQDELNEKRRTHVKTNSWKDLNTDLATLLFDEAKHIGNENRHGTVTNIGEVDTLVDHTPFLFGRDPLKHIGVPGQWPPWSGYAFIPKPWEMLPGRNVGKSEAMVDFFEQLTQFARSDSSDVILIEGPTGIGKNMAAEGIKELMGEPEVRRFSCAEVSSLSDDKMDERLFGKVRDDGSYQMGVVEQTIRYKDEKGEVHRRGGLLIIDELPDASPALQAKLLRVLDDRKSILLPNGEELSLAGLKIVCLANRPISNLRNDLVNRINMRITVPLVYKRGEDIVLLAEYFNYVASLENDIPWAPLDSFLGDLLKRYSYRFTADTGNIRELKHLMEDIVRNRAILLRRKELPEGIRTKFSPYLITWADLWNIRSSSSTVEGLIDRHKEEFRIESGDATATVGDVRTMLENIEKSYREKPLVPYFEELAPRDANGNIVGFYKGPFPAEQPGLTQGASEAAEEGRDEGGRFAERRGKNALDLLKVFALSEFLQPVLQNPKKELRRIALDDYPALYNEVRLTHPELGFEALAQNWERTAKRDFAGLVRLGSLEATSAKNEYVVTGDGLAEIRALRAEYVKGASGESTAQQVTGEATTSPQAAPQEEFEGRPEITLMFPLASEAGREIPTHPSERYTLLMPVEFFANGELQAHKTKYGDRFDLDTISGITPEQFMGNILSKAGGKEARTVALIPRDYLTADQLAKLTGLGIRFIPINRTDLLNAKNLKDSYREKFQKNTYAVMMLVRSITKDITKDSPLYKLLAFYLRTHFGFTLSEGEKLTAEDYINAIVTNNIAIIIRGYLSYRPIEKYSTPAYEQVAATLLAA